jgi:hypothetical protein
LKAINGNESDLIIGRLFDHYYEMNEGIGVHKSPELYGAFPTDPYSHTPGGKGAQQPGMTGQVKEDILSRFGELGVFVSEGCLVFNPSMLRKEEFLKKTTTFQYFSVTGNQDQIELKEGTLAFTYCQIPIVYELGNTSGLRIKSCNQEVYETDHLRLDQNTSRKIFKRTGEIDSITVYVIK